MASTGLLWGQPSDNNVLLVPVAHVTLGSMISCYLDSFLKVWVMYPCLMLDGITWYLDPALNNIKYQSEEITFRFFFNPSYFSKT